MTILSALVLAVIVSIDTFASGFGYGASKTKVPLRHIVVIDIIGSILLGSGLLLGFLVGHLVHTDITKVLSIGILVAMGGYKILSFVVKRIKKSVDVPCEIKWTETIVLAVALSFDNMAVGIGAAIHDASLVFCIAVIVFSIATDFLFFISGHSLGEKVTKKTSLDLSWLSGVVLITAGALKIWL